MIVTQPDPEGFGCFIICEIGIVVKVEYDDVTSVLSD